MSILKLALVGFFAWLIVRGKELQKEEDLYPTLKHFILSSEDRQKAGRAAAETVRNHRGAALRNIKIIEETRSA